MYNKVVFISYTLKNGGAGIAADKFRQLLSDEESYVASSYITQDTAGKLQLLKRLISYALVKLQITSNPVKCSLNLFSYKPVLDSFKLNKEAIHHLHWINNDTLSIFDFDMIPQGTVFTLHDEWLYCGAEHCYSVEDPQLYFINGYSFLNNKISGVNWNYIVWRIKLSKLSHRKDIIITGPSNWIVKRAKSSMILKDLDVYLLPNPVDTGTFYRQDSGVVDQFRDGLGLEKTDFVFAFGAIGGKSNKLKGSGLLDEAFLKLRQLFPEEHSSRVKLLTFGDNYKGRASLHGFDTISLGHISSINYLAVLYSAVNCVVVPSLVESFGQVAAEASACETPVICFATSGLLDVIKDNETGLYANCFCSSSLSEKLVEIIEMPSEELERMGMNGRSHVVTNFSYPVVKKLYLKILDKAAEKYNA